MLYPYQSAGGWRAPIVDPGLFAHRPGELAAALIHLLGKSFSADPVVFRPQGGGVLLLLYRDVAAACGDLIESCGEAMAAVSRHWPLSVLGTVGGRETGELTAKREGEGISIRFRCVSGGPFEVMNSLCVRLETDSPETARHMAAAARAMDFRERAAALPQEHLDFLRDQDLLAPLTGTLFCHVPLEPGAGPRDFLRALSAPQKEALWQTFLEDKVQPREFQWLWEESQTGEPQNLLEWEITLQEVLDSLGYRVSNDQGEFQVLDGAGNPRRFDFIHGGGAEKMFLRILFPRVSPR